MYNGLLLTGVIFFQLNNLTSIILVWIILYFFISPIMALSDSLAFRQATNIGISFGSIRSWGSIDFAVSALFIGMIFENVDIKYLFIFLGITNLLISLNISDIKPDPNSVELKDVFILFNNKRFIAFLFVMVFITISQRINDNFIGLYIVELNGTESIIGFSWFIAIMSDAIIFVTARFWFKKFHPLIFIIMSGTIYSIRWLLYGLIDNAFLIILLQLFNGLSFGIFYIAALDYITRLLPRYIQTTGHLLFFAVFFGVSGIISSLIGGIIIDKFSGGTLYPSSTVAR